MGGRAIRCRRGRLLVGILSDVTGRKHEAEQSENI